MHSNSVQENPETKRDPRRWWALVALCASTLVLVIDAQVLTVAIPALTEDLGATGTEVQWINASYLLVLAGLLLSGGSLGDRIGRRRAMLVGLVVFGAASLGAAYAPSSEILIAARAAMGVGAALVLPSTLSILITVFGPDERPKAIAAWSAVAMVGLVGGPVLGGFLVSSFWWGAVFLINVPVVAISIAAALALMPESKGPPRRPDIPGAVLSVIAMAATIWTIISLPETGFTPGVIAGAVTGVVALIAFAAWELRAKEPMVPIELFRSSDFSGSCLSLTLVFIGYGGMLFALTQYLQFVLGYTPVEAGLALLPLAGALTLASAVGASLGKRFGNRALMVGGFGVMAAAFLLLSRLDTDTGYGLVGAAMALVGAGAGLAQLTAIAVLMNAVPEEHAGIGSAVNDTMQQAGSALGIAILGSVLTAAFAASMPDSAPEQARGSIGEAIALAGRSGDAALASAARGAFVDGMSLMFAIGAIVVAAAAVLSLVVIRDRRPSPSPSAPVGEPGSSAA